MDESAHVSEGGEFLGSKENYSPFKPPNEE
jgi:hypothetical protein